MLLYYKQLGWASSYIEQKSKSTKQPKTRFQLAKEEQREIKFPERNVLFYLIDDIQKIGLWSGESSLNDQALFYYSKLYKIELESFECDIIKQCSSVFVQSYRLNDKTNNPAPFEPLRTQSEVNAKDERLLKMKQDRSIK